MKEREGVKRKKYEIKVTVVKGNGNKSERTESGGKRIEENVNASENDKQAMLEEAVIEFIKIVQRERLKILKKDKIRQK